jgi:hypothetical protein
MAVVATVIVATAIQATALISARREGVKALASFVSSA